MAMIRKCKLSWATSEADHVVGYRLYWAKGTSVGYDSECIEVGKVTEIAIPDGITPCDGPVMFGITALDNEGNESDMTTIAEPFLIQVPEAPRSLSHHSTRPVRPSRIASSSAVGMVAAEVLP